MPKTAAPKTPESLTWQVWPARQKPAAAAAAVALVLGVSWYGYFGFGSLIYSAVALVVLTASLTHFLFPSTYTLDAGAATLRGFLFSRRKGWDDLGCFLVGSDFIALSTSPEPSERTISRGMVLRLDANKEDVTAFVARHLPQWKAPEAADDNP